MPASNVSSDSPELSVVSAVCPVPGFASESSESSHPDRPRRSSVLPGGRIRLGSHPAQGRGTNTRHHPASPSMQPSHPHHPADSPSHHQGPTSPPSCTPSASRSVHTKSPIDAGSNMPASNVRSLSPDVSAVSAVWPVPGLASESRGFVAALIHRRDRVARRGDEFDAVVTRHETGERIRPATRRHRRRNPSPPRRRADSPSHHQDQPHHRPAHHPRRNRSRQRHRSTPTRTCPHRESRRRPWQPTRRVGFDRCRDWHRSQANHRHPDRAEISSSPRGR